jgi:hypothetical protein
MDKTMQLIKMVATMLKDKCKWVNLITIQTQRTE